MVVKRLSQVLFVLVAVLTLAVAGWKGAGASPPTARLDLHFITYTQAGFPEQDVFVEASNSGQVMRLEGSQAADPSNQTKSVFSASSAVAHDPFKLGPAPLGPFSKGSPLNFNLQDWSAATGSGSYTANGDNSTLDASFQKLVANGTYSIWCVRVTFPPTWREVFVPCGAADGSQNTFKADAQGNATFNISLKALPESDLSASADFVATIQVTGTIQSVNGDNLVLTDGTTIQLNSNAPNPAWQPGQTVTLTALVDSDQLVEMPQNSVAATLEATSSAPSNAPTDDNTATVIEVIYHSDGQTKGANPGDFGLTSHVQLLGVLPGPGVSSVMLGLTSLSVGTSPTAEANCADTKNRQPVAARLADAFNVPYDQIMLLHCQNHWGFGEIARAYLLARNSGQSVDQIIAQRNTGQGWGQIVKNSGVSPKDLAPGSVIKQGNKGGQAPAATEQGKGKGKS